ncbi:sulfatase [Hyunsoonleella flava]|uniref:Sulfatase n=1 Tax=Hyunsoonleella flava TaxID=2527939 RepID=A0A4Q9FHI3_9FLAO|nr:sulfatase-like hydrolase/transferase [Hyunsoonleella flava]TBN06528.1 sulfatase [Hyunsoonleella flava]
MKLPIKNILILAYFVKDFDVYLDRLNYFGLSASVAIYCFFFLLLVLSVLIIAHIKNSFVRIIIGVIFFICVVSFDSYQRIMLEPFDYNAYINMIDAAGSAGEALQQYAKSYLISAGYALLLLIGIILKPKKWIVNSLYLKAIPVFSFLLFTFLIFYKGGSGALGLPSFYTPLSYSSLVLYELSQDDFGTREDISIERINTEIGHDIIFILDESVVANYLDINNTKGVNTSLKETYPNIDIVNYGYAVSIANCSYSSNITLRYGGTRGGYKKIIYSKPSIWQYAQNAGLKTVYIDAQRTEGELQNGMTDRELKNIDKFIQFDNVSVQNRDQEAANVLIDLINNNTDEFVFVNKMGLHFPIHDKYPDEFLKYKPALPRGNWLDVSDTGLRTGFNGTPEEWIRYRNSYRNTVEWNVGEFFSKIIKNANLNNSVVIYTSDHGQDLHERKNPGVNTHCSANPTIEEGLVPLVVIQGNNLNTLNWKKTLNDNKNKSSHYNIFPTLLKIMKYDSVEVAKVYGNSLDVKTNDDFSFNKYWNARLGQKPKWEKINLDKIVSPPEEDFLRK